MVCIKRTYAYRDRRHDRPLRRCDKRRISWYGPLEHAGGLSPADRGEGILGSIPPSGGALSHLPSRRISTANLGVKNPGARSGLPTNVSARDHGFAGLGRRRARRRGREGAPQPSSGRRGAAGRSRRGGDPSRSACGRPSTRCPEGGPRGPGSDVSGVEGPKCHGAQSTTRDPSIGTRLPRHESGTPISPTRGATMTDTAKRAVQSRSEPTICRFRNTAWANTR